MNMRNAVFLLVNCAVLSAAIIVTPAVSGPPYYHDEGNVNYPGSYFESSYVAKGIGVDDYITIVDLALGTRAFGGYVLVPGDPGGVGWGIYNIDVDFNGDLRIDVRDLANMAKHWGLNYHYSPFEPVVDATKVKVVVPVDPVKVGEQFSAVIEIENVEELNAFEFTLSWDFVLFKAISVVVGGFIPSQNHAGIINNTAGYLYFGADSWEPIAQSGSGILATVIFECMEIGASTLDLSSRLFNIELESLPHRDEDSSLVTGTPGDRTQSLIETIKTWNLPMGVENSLTSKLTDALNLLERGNENGAVHKLMDFTEQVEALRGSKLTNEQADYLISTAQEIISLIEP